MDGQGDHDGKDAEDPGHGPEQRAAGGAAQGQGAGGVHGVSDGLVLAQACSQPGMVATGTKVELVKARGMTGSRLAVPAVSGSRTVRPIRAEIHDNR
jgi:hypothetical protein